MLVPVQGGNSHINFFHCVQAQAAQMAASMGTAAINIQKGFRVKKPWRENGLPGFGIQNR